MVRSAATDVTPEADMTVRRLDRTTLDRVAPWLVERLRERWPEAGQAWIAKLVGMLGQNDFLPVWNELAVGCFAASRHPLSGQVLVAEVFAFAKNRTLIRPPKGAAYKAVTAGSEDEEALTTIVDSALSWATSMSAITIIGIHNDLSSQRLVNLYSAQQLPWLLVE